MSDQVALRWLDAAGIRWAQALVTDGHYLRRPVDARCSVQGYAVLVADELAGCLLFGRPQATVCRPWYGSLEALAAGRVECSRWSVLNLARAYLLPQYQAGGELCRSELLPGFTDRRGVWRSTLASTAISMACERVVLDYLLARPPVWLGEPYELAWIMSYCDRRLHRGTIYPRSGFAVYWQDTEDLQKPVWTYRHRARALKPAEHEMAREASRRDGRARAHRGDRMTREAAVPLF